MCGIVGIVEPELGRSIPAAEVQHMVRTLNHRGPDEEGSVRLPGVALAMRRLSIVDLAGGQQPFSNEDGTIQVVANGEIYNFAEVRRELEQRGHAFHSRSDIEVLAHAYEEYGEAFLGRLRGMFALALWDGRTRTLLAARDRAGEKPLYYAQTPSGLLLGSEIKALLSRAEVSREVDLEAIDQFLTYEYIIAPRTIFKHIHKLPAAHYLRYRDGAIEVRRYWDAADVPVRAWSEAEARDAVREMLAEAVRSQMMADVPIGLFLSGGIDSSAVAVLLREAGAASAISSFSMGFGEGSYNELPYAREIAALCGTQHHERTVSSDVRGLFERLVHHLDEPFADVSLFPTFLVSQIAREHVKVVLTGDGGDELFGGYDAYEAQALAARWDGLMPAAASRAADAVLSRLYTRGLQEAMAGSDVYRPVQDALARYGGDDLLNRQLYADLSIYLADDILVKVDRMSMATSLETRAPFLDARMMELAFSMPGELKIRKGTRKYILKRALEGLVPAGILHRKKEGFSIPMKNWLRGELRPLMAELLAEDRVQARGLVEPSEVARLIREHCDQRENHAHVLFSLMVLEQWYSTVLS